MVHSSKTSGECKVSKFFYSHKFDKSKDSKQQTFATLNSPQEIYLIYFIFKVKVMKCVRIKSEFSEGLVLNFFSNITLLFSSCNQCIFELLLIVCKADKHINVSTCLNSTIYSLHSFCIITYVNIKNILILKKKKKD